MTAHTKEDAATTGKLSHGMSLIPPSGESSVITGLNGISKEVTDSKQETTGQLVNQPATSPKETKTLMQIPNKETTMKILFHSSLSSVFQM